MTSEDFYWVVHILGGSRRFEGPYRTYEAAENRARSIQGGEVHILHSWSNSPEQAQQEFAGEVASGA